MTAKDRYTYKENQEVHNNWAATYEKDARKWQYSTPRKLAERLKPHLKPGMKIIDLGCGTGLNIEQYPELGLDWTGVDCSREMLKKAREKGYKTFQRDVRKTGLPANAFDASICTSVLEIYANIEPNLREMKRIVKPAGLVAFTVVCSPIKGLRRVSKPELEEMISACSLDAIELFRILSHYENARDPKYFWVTIARNLK